MSKNNTHVYFTDSHEWVALEENVGTVGISSYAQKEFGEIVFLELPQVGQKVKRGDAVCVIESTKAASDVYTPVSGVIVAIHTELLDNLYLLNQSPESAGWLFRIELSHPHEISQLLTQAAYQAMHLENRSD